MAEPNAFQLLQQSFRADPNALELLQQSISPSTAQAVPDIGQQSAMSRISEIGSGAQPQSIQQQGVTSTGIVDTPVSPQDERANWLREQIANGNIEPTPLSYWEKLKGELPQIAGEEIGAFAGAFGGARAAAKLPVGHPLAKGALIAGGAIAGAGVGAMGGKGFEQAYRMTRPGSKSMSFNDIYREQMWAAVEGVVSEAVGRGFVAGGSRLLKTGVGQKILAPAKRHLIPNIEKLDAILKRAGRTLPPDEAAKLTEHARDLLSGTGSFLTAAQKTQARPIDFVENAVEQSMFGGNRLFQLKRMLQPATYKHAVKEMSDKFWSEAGGRMSPAEAGRLFVDTVTNQRTVQNSLTRTAYKQVDHLTKTAVPIDFRVTKKLANELFDTASKSKGLGQQKSIRVLANKVKKWADNPGSFMEGHAMISDLGDEVRRLEALGGGIKLPKVDRVAKMLDAEATRAMNSAARSAGPEAFVALQSAQKMVKEGKGVLNSAVTEGAMRLARKNPEKLTGEVFTKHGTQQLKAIKGAIDTKTYDTLFASYLDDVLTRHSGLAYETRMVPSGTRILDFMDKNLGEDMMQEMFKTPEHLQDFLDVMNLGFTLERKNQAGGGMLIQLLQAGGIADIGTKALAGETPKAASWAITMGPALAGRLFANPKGAKWLSTGFKLTGTAQDKWFAKIPPSIVRILREGLEEREPNKRRVQVPPARQGQAFRGGSFR